MAEIEQQTGNRAIPESREKRSVRAAFAASAVMVLAPLLLLTFLPRNGDPPTTLFGQSVAQLLLLTFFLLPFIAPFPALIAVGRYRSRNAYWWLLTFLGALAMNGAVGMFLGTMIFRNSNLLGGFAIFYAAPLWAGLAGAVVVCAIWLVHHACNNIFLRRRP